MMNTVRRYHLERGSEMTSKLDRERIINSLQQHDGCVIEPTVYDYAFCVTVFRRESAYESSIFDSVEQQCYAFPDYVSAIGFVASLDLSDGEYIIHRIEAFEEEDYIAAENDIWMLKN